MTQLIIFIAFLVCLGAVGKLFSDRCGMVLSNSRPLRIDVDGGEIEPDRGIYWLVTLIGIILLTYAAVGPFRINMWLSIPFVLAGLMSVGPSVPALFVSQNLIWDKNGVSGNCSLFLLSLGFRRTSISWQEIESTGTTKTMFWYLKSHDGRRIYWAYTFNGFEDFARVLERERPDIEIPRLPEWFEE